jgi:hypothetical protein
LTIGAQTAGAQAPAVELVHKSYVQVASPFGPSALDSVNHRIYLAGGSDLVVVKNGAVVERWDAVVAAGG